LTSPTVFEKIADAYPSLRKKNYKEPVRKILLFVSFILGDLTVILLAFLFLTVSGSQSSVAEEAPAEEVVPPSAAVFTAPENLYPLPSGAVLGADARPLIVERFLERYRSPMTGLGGEFVAAADRHRLPYGLLPAIGFCEGGLGRAIPPNSFNTWGWGIYGNLVTRFSSWQEGIETVAQGIRRDYFDQGLDSPEEMMSRYTPPSKGTWAFCINKYMQELSLESSTR
jgi:hypothetical protein